jgi:4-amino-4-deoxy-L-arabinose transferase-like glycosyltransferase
VQFTLQARRAQLDALLMFFTVLSLYCLCRQLLLGGGWRWAIAAGAAAGLGVLAKMVGFLSFLLLVPWLFAVWRGWPGVKFERPWFGWIGAGVACMAVVACWILPLWVAAQRDPAVQAYVDEVLVEQTVGRFASPWHHYKPWHYYLTSFPPLWLPLTLLLPWLVPAWWRALRARDVRVLLPLAFVILYVGFFSLSSGKRDVYIFAALPVLVLASTPELPRLLRRRSVQSTLLAFLWIVGAVLIAAWAYFTFFAVARGAELLEEGGLASAAPVLAMGVVAITAVLVCRRRRAGVAVVAFFTCTWMLLGFWVFPQMDGQRSASNFIAAVESKADPLRPLALLEYRENFLWNLRRESWNFGHRRFREGDQEMFDAAAWLAQDERRQLLVADDRRQRCFPATMGVEVGETGDRQWWLVSGVPDAECTRQGDPGRAIRYVPLMPKTLL